MPVQHDPELPNPSWVISTALCLALEPGPTEVLLKVAACGVCRSDYQLLDGYFKKPFPVEFPYIPGHEVTGRVAGLGNAVPKAVGYSEGDMVAVSPSWGDGTCRQCREGNEQLCSGNGRWLGFGPPGGFAEYVVVESRYAIRVSGEAAKTPEFLAPMTDAGMTPYRGMRKLSSTGRLGPDRTVAVTGIGGLGSYVVQYAKLFGAGSTVVALGRSDDTLDVARQNGAELTYMGSFWGNYLDLAEVLSLAEAGLVKHDVTKIRLEDINEKVEALGRGDVVGRQVIVFD
ncbi:MAG TPA: alcohol dehydrogenase catalytic domain-containing protein [Trebonia sp.]|nr:alcohol dehydrogenase catalytic domain-containing protein [Trebonia sp.]